MAITGGEFYTKYITIINESLLLQIEYYYTK